ncbi:hypothetical protein SRIMM317S_03025 [Streptomyces rimosus subsp. rimosus]
MSVLLEQPSSLVAYRPNKPTAMVVVADLASAPPSPATYGRSAYGT